MVTGRQNEKMRGFRWGWAGWMALCLAGVCLTSLAAEPGHRPDPGVRAFRHRAKANASDWQKKQTLAFIGDSLTVGLCASRQELRFADLVQAKLGEGGLPASRVSAKVGATVASLGKPSQGAYFLSPATPDVDAIVVELGTNDVGTTPLPVFEARFMDFLAKLRARAPQAVIVCLGVWQGRSGEAYDKVLSNCAARSGASFFSLAGIYKNIHCHARAGAVTPWGTADSFHPSDEGHARIAQSIEAALLTIRKSR